VTHRLSDATRKRVMQSIRAKDTKPEMIVRRLLFGLGARYRLHANDLPGRPDIVMRSRWLAIQVHGCFWHLHESCRLTRIPRSRPDYWPAKLQGNKARDARNLAALRGLGWRVLVVWECETRSPERLVEALRQFVQTPLPTPVELAARRQGSRLTRYAQAGQP
jgi:DNA mismatch endonuclease Vsr